MILADTHIHLGLSRRGEPVKVSASRNLTLAAVPGILQAYGADLGAVVDLGTSRGLRDLEEGLAKGELREAEDGAFVAPVGSRILGALEAEFDPYPLGSFERIVQRQADTKEAAVWRKGVGDHQYAAGRLDAAAKLLWCEVHPLRREPGVSDRSPVKALYLA